jgi:hypothetical protein
VGAGIHLGAVKHAMKNSVLLPKVCRQCSVLAALPVQMRHDDGKYAPQRLDESTCNACLLIITRRHAMCDAYLTSFSGIVACDA